jgi:hypothetical protein
LDVPIDPIYEVGRLPLDIPLFRQMPKKFVQLPALTSAKPPDAYSASTVSNSVLSRDERFE